MQTIVEKNIEDMLVTGLKELGYHIVRVKLIQDKSKILQIMIQRSDGKPVTADDCEKVSFHVSPILDVKDFIKEQYDLEISSAGLDRPLVKLKDFEEYIGFQISLETMQPINGSKKFSGRIFSVQDSLIEVRAINSKQSTFINYDLIEEASLILCDELLRKTKH